MGTHRKLGNEVEIFQEHCMCAISTSAHSQSCIIWMLSAQVFQCVWFSTASLYLKTTVGSLVVKGLAHI